MPGAKLKPLYLSKNLSDLQPKYDITVQKDKKAKLLANTAEKIFEKAEKEELNGDEEQSYILFMKYLNVLSFIQKTDDYRKDTSLLNKNKFQQALNRAQKLSTSLEQRYKLISQQAVVDAELLAQEHKQAEEEIKRLEKLSLATDIINNGPRAQLTTEKLADASAVSLSSLQLYNLVVKNKMHVLILDARRSSCFTLSHMTLPRCINIPDDLIQPGVSAGSLAKHLPPESADAFDKRGEATLIVLLDWSATHKTLSPGSKLYTLKNILLKWDPKIIYHSEPLILEKGYNDWVDHFPTFTTDPVTKPPKSDSTDDFLDFETIEYPTLNDSTPEPTPKSAAVIPNRPTAMLESIASNTRPGVDRGLKAAAIKTYEEKMKEYTALLEAREKGADSSLIIERDRLETEKKWEETRRKKEMEAEGEIRQELQAREDHLLKSLSQLEEKQRQKEAENQALRHQLQEYQRKEMDESNRLADIRKRNMDAEANAKIHNSEVKAKALSKEREEIARLRYKKLKADGERRQQEEARRAEQERIERLNQEKNNAGVYYKPLQTEPQPGSSIMKRSHSSPNIAQMLDDEDPTAKHKAPQFDRAIKPLQKPKTSDVNAARQRFDMVWGTKGSGLTGLKNLGNTCYMNSIIQCISNTVYLTKYFCNGEYRKDINRQNKTQGEIVCEFANVVRNLWNKQFRLTSCPDLKSVVGRHKEEFRGSQQQDSHEFLFFLINWLHDDLNKKTSKSELDLSLPRTTDADKHWAEFRRCNESIILDLFYGQQKSTIICLKCNERSSTYEPFNHISLPLPNTNSRCSFDECLKLYMNGDRITGWNCPSCKEARDAVKKFDICKLPPVLVIQFKRFYHDGWSRKKQTMVEFPITDLVMQSWQNSNTGAVMTEKSTYNLYGVSNHYGTMEGGHYTAYCKNYVFSKWYKFDDHEVNEISESEVRSSAAYILFYYSDNNKLAVPSDR